MGNITPIREGIVDGLEQAAIDPAPRNDVVCVRKVWCEECNGSGCDACDGDGYTSYIPVQGWKACPPNVIQALNGIMFAREFPKLPFLTYPQTVIDWLKK